MPDLPHLRWLIEWAADAGAPEWRLRAASRELVDMEDLLACPPDPRRVRTLHRAQQLLASGIDRQGSGLSRAHFNRLLRLARLSRANPAVPLQFASWISSPLPEDPPDG
jgi:hypothetical protein